MEKLDSVVADMPKVSPELSGADSGAPSVAPEGIKTDREGRSFNSEIHEADEMGNPVIGKDGYLNLKRGRKKGGSSPLDNPETRGTFLAAQTSALLFVNIGVGIFGNDWSPEKTDKYDEQEHLINSFFEYYKYKGITDIPPDIAFYAAIGGYAFKRMSKEEPRKRMGVILSALKGKMSEFGKKINKLMNSIFKGKRNFVNASQFNTRNDGDGKNDAGAGPSETV